MALILVPIPRKRDLESVVERCRRIGNVKTSNTAAVVVRTKSGLRTKNVIAYLNYTFGVSARKIKNKAAR